MGQYWQLINLDKRQTFGNRGKLGEYLFTGWPKSIVPYLVLPALSEVRNSDDDGARLRILQAIKAVSWAGDRIICIGDYTKKLPPDMLSDIEETQENIWEVAESGYTSPEDIEQYREFIDYKIPTSWVLRNLSEHTYVRAEAVALDPDFIDGPWIKYFGFGHIVLSYIHWSADASRSSSCSADIVNGDWAGNRFDIVSIDTLRTSGEQWEDVSEEIVETVKSYFEEDFSDYGMGILEGLEAFEYC